MVPVKRTLSTQKCSRSRTIFQDPDSDQAFHEIPAPVTHIIRGLYFVPKTIFIPLPLLKMRIFPLLRQIIFRLPSKPFITYFCSILYRFYPYTFPVIILFPFLPFSFTFSPIFLFTFSYFSPQMTLADISPRRGIFQYIMHIMEQKNSRKTVS